MGRRLGSKTRDRSRAGSHHPLTHSLTAVRFAAQVDFALEAYRDTSLTWLRSEEWYDPRYWWRRREERR